MADHDSPGPTIARVFDSIAETYDQTGVDFFRPVAERLVALLAPAPGSSALDVGCGRGAATLPLAAAVGAAGRVDAVDVSPAMAAATQSVVEAAGHRHVQVLVSDADDLTAAVNPPYDLVASSLVLFFLVDPAAALRSWVDLLVPGGRIGLTTFGTLDDATAEIDELLLVHQPPTLRDARTNGAQGPFASDAGMEELVRAAGASSVTTTVEPAVLEFADVDQWLRFSMSTGQRAMWANVPEPERPRVVERAAEILATTNPGGPGRLVWQMRYTLGTR
ncbi:MAG: class I SAM-dependent methyltransferase [Marmoricola sp.]